MLLAGRCSPIWRPGERLSIPRRGREELGESPHADVGGTLLRAQRMGLAQPPRLIRESRGEDSLPESPWRGPVNHREIVSFLWGVADLIRDTFKRGKYQDVLLPVTLLRRLDCVLEPTKAKVLATQAI